MPADCGTCCLEQDQQRTAERGDRYNFIAVPPRVSERSCPSARRQLADSVKFIDAIVDTDGNKRSAIFLTPRSQPPFLTDLDSSQLCKMSDAFLDLRQASTEICLIRGLGPIPGQRQEAYSEVGLIPLRSVRNLCMLTVVPGIVLFDRKYACLSLRVQAIPSSKNVSGWTSAKRHVLERRPLPAQPRSRMTLICIAEATCESTMQPCHAGLSQFAQIADCGATPATSPLNTSAKIHCRPARRPHPREQGHRIAMSTRSCTR